MWSMKIAEPYVVTRPSVSKRSLTASLMPSAGSSGRARKIPSGTDGIVGILTGSPNLLPWHVRGAYLESCNCDPICPCRQVGGRPGGRSTHGVCLGALSWSIEEGIAGDVELSGLGTVLAFEYSDD